MLNLNKDDPIILNDRQKKIIRKFGRLEVKHWRRNEKTLRIKIRDDLIGKQNECCVYCGCKVFDKGDVEHIAHKASYTQFMFTPLNLAFSCKTCNQTYKGEVDVVAVENPTYEKCVFKMVHPYLDDVDRFFDTTRITIRIREGLSTSDYKKALFTTELLRWTSEEVVFKREQQFAANKFHKEHRLTPAQHVMLDKTVTYNQYK